MPNLGKVLKDETVRISKREARSVIRKPIHDLMALRRAFSALKKRMDLIEKSRPALATTAPAAAETEASAEAKIWFTPRGILALRRKLKVSQAKFASLLGVSAQAVYTWERQDHHKKLVLRGTTIEALVRARDLSVREAEDQLAATPKKPAARRKAARKAPSKRARHAS